MPFEYLGVSGFFEFVRAEAQQLLHRRVLSGADLRELHWCRTVEMDTRTSTLALILMAPERLLGSQMHRIDLLL